MASGLIALLDDVAMIAKVAAASLDDTAAAAARASAKAAGVVIDDAAVTPRYVHGFTADRELPIVGKIALGSLRNKLLILLPGALLLSWLAPWAITPLLVAGGSFLCFEAAEKLWELVSPHAAHEEAASGDPQDMERQMVSGAIRTDLILSGEIMAIALASVADVPLAEQAVVLVVVGLGITALVYGAVALIVKADDVGLRLAKSGAGLVASFGRFLVRAMPPFLTFLSGLGTFAMLWVGGGIVVHGLEEFGVEEPGHSLHGLAEAAGEALAPMADIVVWLVQALGSGLFGLLLGAVIVAILHLVPRRSSTQS